MAETSTLDNVFRQEEVLDLNVSFNEFEEEVAATPVVTNVQLKKTSETCSSTPRRDFENEIPDGEIDSQEHRFLYKNNESGEKENCRKTLKEAENEKLEVFDLREKLDSRSRAKRPQHSPTTADSSDYNESLANYSSEENFKQFKKQRLEYMEVDEGLETTQPASEEIKKRRGGVKKKKKKKHCHFQRKYIVPRIGNLFKPLNLVGNDTPDTVAREISYRLNEEKTRLIKKCVNCIGCEKALDLFNETKMVQREGGMKTLNGNRRRTNGGVFLSLLKSGGYATKEQIKEIFAEEKAAAKEKERKTKLMSRMKEDTYGQETEETEHEKFEEANMSSCPEEEN